MADVAARLEAVVARLEALASNLSSGGGDSAEAAPSGDSPKFVTAFEELLDGPCKDFISASASIEGAKKLEIDAMANTFYSEVGKVMKMAADCKKPDQKTLMTIMKPVTELFPKADKAAFKRGDYRDHATAFKEMLQMVNFLFVPKPRGFCEDSYTLPDVYLNKILTKAKKQEEGLATKNRAFVKAAKAIGVGLKDYVKEYHPTGVSWKKDGADAKTWTPGAAPAGGAPAPPPMAPPPMGLGPPPVMTAADYGTSPAPAKKSAPGGMAAVFAQISKGSDQCESEAKGGATAAFGLKKVTKEMKKAMKKQPGLKPKEKKKTEKKKVIKKKIVKPPSKEFRQGTWWVENQVEDNEVSGVELKHNVYVYNAQKCTITIPGKIKSITMDSCKRATIIFDQVISVFELVGCESCKVFCRQGVPSVAIDKSKGTQVNLNAVAAQSPPDIVTSNISETNLVMPGKDPEKDDPIEMPLPEQYITKISGANGAWETDTTMVTHGG